MQEIRVTQANNNNQEAILRSRSLFFAPGPNRSWKLISSVINSSIIFIVGGGEESSSNESDSDGAGFSPTGDSVRVWSLVTMASFSGVGWGPWVTLRTFVSASLRLPRSSALACSLPTHSTKALTRLFMSPMLVRLLGHFTFTPRSVDISAKSFEARISSGRGMSVGSMGSKCAR